MVVANSTYTRIQIALYQFSIANYDSRHITHRFLHACMKTLLLHHAITNRML